MYRLLLPQTFPIRTAVVSIAVWMVAVATGCANQATTSGARWLAGDHHVHSHFSVGWDFSVEPPAPIIGGDAGHAIPDNVLMGKHFGLDWMVATDHGGPNHSKINREQAYPELLRSRLALPEVIQFYGLELNTPGGEHSSLIVPHTHDEADVLVSLEAGFDNLEAFPIDPTRDTEPKMLEALRAMRELPEPPVLIANHPSRTATGKRKYGAYTPAELRRWNDTAPNVAVGMAGAPGHQAAQLGSMDSMREQYEEVKRIAEATKNPALAMLPPLPSNLPRGGYLGFPTLGGFDQMTALLGGFWDSMLAEGRRWWITANSDFHRHYSSTGFDFWPGEYSKTYVYAEKNHDAVLAALRAGQVFVTTGDLISELELRVTSGSQSARMGGELTIAPGSEVEVSIRIRDPNGLNSAEQNPTVARVDLIAGDVIQSHGAGVHAAALDPSTDRNDSTRVLHRFQPADWQRDGEILTMSIPVQVEGPMYLRLRGTNTDELEPEPDSADEDLWGDLWFYSNPVFVAVE